MHLQGHVTYGRSGWVPMPAPGIGAALLASHHTDNTSFALVRIWYWHCLSCFLTCRRRPRASRYAYRDVQPQGYSRFRGLMKIIRARVRVQVWNVVRTAPVVGGTLPALYYNLYSITIFFLLYVIVDFKF
jgi:hypothetical protein